jgi:excisionase family DNA binding protein
MPDEATRSRRLTRSRPEQQRTAATTDVLNEILTAEQVADLLRMRRSTVEDYGRRGVLPSIKLGRHRRYVRSDIVAFLERLR